MQVPRRERLGRAVHLAGTNGAADREIHGLAFSLPESRASRETKD